MHSRKTQLIFGGIIISLIFANLLIYHGLVFIFFESDKNIIIGFLGFWGALLSGLVAYLVAANQIRAQNAKADEQEIKNARSFIILEELTAPIKLNGIITHENSKILSNEYYEDVKEHFREDGIFIPFYKIHHSGNSDIILDCHIEAVVEGDDSSEEFGYHISSHLSVLEKGTEIFIPVANVRYKEILMKSLTITYKTLRGELIFYKYDPVRMREKHELIVKNNLGKIVDRQTLYDIDLRGISWVYPAKFKN